MQKKKTDAHVIVAILSRVITKTCPCNKQRFFFDAKIENFIGNILICLTCLLKTHIVGTR